LNFCLISVPFVDIDECKLGLCAQVCDNTVGSYMCKCLPGYELSADKTSCTGT